MLSLLTLYYEWHPYFNHDTLVAAIGLCVCVCVFIKGNRDQIESASAAAILGYGCAVPST